MAENVCFFLIIKKKALKIYPLILFQIFAASLASALYTVVQARPKDAESLQRMQWCLGLVCLPVFKWFTKMNFTKSRTWKK